MTNIKILCFHEIFVENARILAQRLDCEFVNGEYKPDTESNDVLIIFGSHVIPHVLISLLQDFVNLTLIVIQTEQMHSAVFENKFYLKILQHKNCFVFDWSQENALALKRKYDVNVVSLYSFDFYAKEPFIKYNDRPIDICFVGAYSDERKIDIDRIKTAYPSYKYFIDMSYNLTNQDKLCSILGKSKIVLNIPFYKGNSLETHRITQALSCGCRVLSKYSADDDLNTAYKNFVYFDNNFVKALSSIDNMHDKQDYKMWNTKINVNSIKHNVETINKIIELKNI